MKDKCKLSTLAEVIKVITQIPERMLSEEVEITGALGRVVGHDLYAPEDLPHFSRSLVDGYAMSAMDTFGATTEKLVHLKLVGQVKIGETAKTPLAAGAVMKVTVGGMLPPGADAVIVPGNCIFLDGETMAVDQTVAPGENLIPAGSDLRAGELVLARGHLIRPQDVGILAALGYDRLYVVKRPKVGILSIGDELEEITDDLIPGRVRDLNTYTLSSLVNCNGGIPGQGGIIQDDPIQLKAALEKNLTLNDLMILTGGNSGRTRECLLNVLTDMGEVICNGLAVQPGQSTIVARADKKLVFGLPGYPVSAMIGFELLVKPYLDHLLNHKQKLKCHIKARTVCEIASLQDQEEYIKVWIEERGGEYWVIPIPGESALISTLVHADGLIKIPANKERLEAGEVVEVINFSGGYL